MHAENTVGFPTARAGESNAVGKRAGRTGGAGWLLRVDILDSSRDEWRSPQAPDAVVKGSAGGSPEVSAEPIELAITGIPLRRVDPGQFGYGTVYCGLMVITAPGRGF